jgi:hypothetical protein
MTTIATLLDEVRAASHIGGHASPISIRTLQRWRVERRGPTFIKVGRMVRYRKSDLDAFIEERTCRTTGAK